MGKLYPLPNRARPRLLHDRHGSDLAPSRLGHTLVELAVAIAIIGILAGMGWTNIQPEVDRFRMMKAARLLHSDLQSLRALAIATNRETRIVFLVADDALDPAAVQAGAWRLQAGDRSNGSVVWDTLPIDIDDPDDSQGERSLAPDGADEVPHVSLARWPALVGPGGGSEDAIVFSPRGWVANPVSDFADGYVDLRIVNKRALLRGHAEEATLRVSRGGLARLEVGASSRLPGNPVGTAEASTP